jgi:hypothetical protein
MSWVDQDLFYFSSFFFLLIFVSLIILARGESIARLGLYMYLPSSFEKIVLVGVLV